MKILLDTHALLWAFFSPEKLSLHATELYQDIDHQLYLSTCSYWEICIKVSLGKLKLMDNWQKVLLTEINNNGIGWLLIQPHHCEGIISLPTLHRDPFDRLLISQALAEEMVLMTSDSKIHQYSVSTVW